MISPKLQKIEITILATTFGLTSLLPVNTATARKKIIFVPPIFGSPQRLIPAGTRVYEPSPGADAIVNPEILPPAAPIDKPQDQDTNTIFRGIIRTPVQRKIPPTGAERESSAPVASQCLQGKLPLTALIPESQIGLTTVANPALFFYVPQTSAPELELVVQNENDQNVHTQTYKSNNKAGIVRLRLPVNSLAVNKQYKWKLSLICNPQDKSQNKAVAGLVQRVLPNAQLIKKLQQATRQERAFVYAEAGVWYDALATVAQLRYLRPNNQELASDWEGLLTANSVALNQQIAQQPLLPQLEALQPKNNQKF